ncbi:MAG: signal peptidase I [Dehalococcoidia bacterium]|nr:signal peptidase I [Dehalococcoidia bacterium]
MSDDPLRREPELPASPAPAAPGAPPASHDALFPGDHATRDGGAASDGARRDWSPAPPSPHVDPYAVASAAAPDAYADVPAALELSYTNADIGLSERAFERTLPYEDRTVRKRRVGRAKARRVGRELVETLLLAVLIFFAVKAVVQNFRVEGSSMMPSLTNNQYLLVNKALYYRIDTHTLNKFLPFIPDSDGERHLFRAPRRGDVIVFKFPLDTSRDFIKRVIGVPGDTVEVRDGKVFINGSPLVEPYEQAAPNYTYGPKTVPPGQYFVLGDNRNNSYDSHAWRQQCSAQQECDFVPEANIIGQAWITYWPWGDLGLVNNTSLKPRAP